MSHAIAQARTNTEFAVLPKHVAIIMDGNGRWAQKRGLPRLIGHKEGTENIRRILRASVEFGIKVLTLYAFSTENWTRPQEEVQGILKILDETIHREIGELNRNGVQLRHLGGLDGLSPALQSEIRNTIELTKNNDRLILNLAFNYGGRQEILNAIRNIVQDQVPPDQITEDLFRRYLYTGDLPDPDLLIRTSGEMRWSNYLLWQAAYAEFYSTPVYWPDFGKEELRQALIEYGTRQRRFGKV
jgi:undecaprenyl diphosphate synthase